MLEQSWRELFVLGAAQYLLPLDIGQLMSLRGALVDRDSAKEASLLHEIKVFHSTVTKFKDHNVDPYEYACLRAIVLFRATGELQLQVILLFHLLRLGDFDVTGCFAVFGRMYQ